MPVTTSQFDGSSDDLAAVAVRRLERRINCESWGLLKTIILGVPSFGLLPLVLWPARFRDYVAEEYQALQDLAQWAKWRGRLPAAVGPLLATAEDTAVSPLPIIVSILAACLIVGVYIIHFAQANFSWDGLLNWTYCIDPSAWTSQSPLPPREMAYRVWVIALSVGYFLHWLQVRTHANDVRRFVERFNPIAQAEGLALVRLSVHGWAYCRPLWLLAAVLLCYWNAWWGIPMIAAAMAQRRYTHITSRKLRNELAKRVKDVVALREYGALHMPVFVEATEQRCSNPRCLAPMKPASRFCSRCGKAINSPEETPA